MTTKYRLTSGALRVLDALEVDRAQFTRLANTITERGEIQVRLRGGDEITFAKPKWFEEAEEYKPGEWNSVKTVRPPRSGEYLLRVPTSGGDYEYRLSYYSFNDGFLNGIAEAKAEFREMPS